MKTSRKTHAHPPRPAEGFTFLELFVAVVIIGVLAGYVAPRYFTQIGKSQAKTSRAQIDRLEKSLEQYRLDTGRYHSMEQGLGALVARPADEPSRDDAYLKKALPLDPWGRPYLYCAVGEHGDFDLVSFAIDGQPGGSVMRQISGTGDP